MLYFETMLGYSNYIQKEVSGLTDGQSCQAIDSFLRGVYINLGEILNSDWLKSCIYFPYTPTQLISKNEKKQEIL
jgi:hypothetical protein